MLKYLLKYDLKTIYKPLLIYAVSLIICAIIARLTEIQYSDLPPYEATTPVFITIIHTICQNAFYALSVGLIVTAFIRIWRRLSTNFYGDEAYLTHTLPVAPKTLWNSKFLASFIIIFACIIIIMLGIFIVYYSPDNFQNFALNLDPTNGGYQGSAIAFAILVTIAAFSQFLFMTQAGQTGIILANRANEHRAVLAIVIGLVIYYASGLISLAFVMVWAALNPTFANNLFSNTIDGNLIPQILIAATVLYTIFTTITYLISRRTLQKGINVD